MIIHLNAVENHLSSLTPKKIVRKGAVNYYEIKVTFSKDWDGLSKVVAIKAPGDEMFKSAYMLLNGRALIPYKDVEEACAARETDDFAVFQAVVYGSAIVGKAGEDKLIPVRIVTNAVTISVDEPEYKGDFYEGLESDEGVNIDVSLKQLAEYAYKLDNYEAYLAAITAAFNEAEEKRQSTFEQNEAGRERQFREAEARRDLWEEYDPKKAYEHGNKVSYKGSSYVMVLPEGSPGLAGAVPGVAKEWLLIAAKGDKGYDAIVNVDSRDQLRSVEVLSDMIEAAGALYFGKLAYVRDEKEYYELKWNSSGGSFNWVRLENSESALEREERMLTAAEAYTDEKVKLKTGKLSSLGEFVAVYNDYPSRREGETWVVTKAFTLPNVIYNSPLDGVIYTDYPLDEGDIVVCRNNPYVPKVTEAGEEPPVVWPGNWNYGHASDEQQENVKGDYLKIVKLVSPKTLANYRPDFQVKERSITTREIALETIEKLNLSDELVRWIESMKPSSRESAIYYAGQIELTTAELMGYNAAESQVMPKYPIIVMPSNATGQASSARPHVDFILGDYDYLSEYRPGTATSRILINPYDAVGYIESGFGGMSNLYRVDIPPRSIGVVTFTFEENYSTYAGVAFRPEYKQLGGDDIADDDEVNNILNGITIPDKK